MVNDALMEAIQWAQRYCIDYQAYKKDDNVTSVFLNEMTGVFGPYLDRNQVDCLLTDLKRFIDEQERLAGTYPDSAPSKAAYEYLDYLVELDIPDFEDMDMPDTEAGRSSEFKMFYWASMYCITRHSYAASYGRDVTRRAERFSDSELRFLLVQLDNYILEAEARAEIFKKDNPDMSDLYGDIYPDVSWYDLRDWLKAWADDEFEEVSAELGSQKEVVKCFKDKRGNYRPIDSFLSNPYIYTYVSPEYIVRTVRLSGPRDLRGNEKKS